VDQGELEKIERQPKYWSVDGLPELMAGLGCLLWGGLYLIGTMLFIGRSYRIYSSVVWLALFLWGNGVAGAIGKLKERLTYPRVGHARVQRRGPGVAAYTVLMLAFAIQFVRDYVYMLDLHGLVPVLVGGIVALAIALPAMRPRTADLAWISLLLLGMQFWLLQRSADYRGMYWTLVCMGLIGVVFGVLRLRRFLRENPKAAEAEA
jgi:hypothetical protein